MDFGSLFGLDLLGDGGKGGGSSMDLGGESEFQDILNLSLQENGISEEVVHQQHIVSTLYIYQALRSRPFFWLEPELIKGAAQALTPAPLKENIT